MSSFVFIFIVVVLAWAYNFLNGANDRANAIATTIATQALSPMRALILASILNLAGAFVTTEVAKTIGKGIVPPESINQTLLISALLGAILWTAFCTKLGIPISVSHSLVGGLMGAGIACGGFRLLNWKVLQNKVLLAIILAPALGFLAGGIILFLIFWLCRNATPRKINNYFRKGQIFTTLFMAFTHGMNDTQNAMGVITTSLLVGGVINSFEVPFWVKLSSGVFMALGTFLMGWRVMKTLGWKMAKIEPPHAFAAELGAGIVIGIKSLIGMPVSTTHVVASAVMGGTATQRLSKVRWLVAGRMVLAWIFTIPGAGLLAGFFFFLIKLL